MKSKNNKIRFTQIKRKLTMYGEIEHEDGLWLIDRVDQLQEQLKKANSRNDDISAELMNANFKLLSLRKGASI